MSNVQECIDQGQVWQDNDGQQWFVVYVTDEWAWVKPRRHRNAPSIQTNRSWFKEWRRIV